MSLLNFSSDFARLINSFPTIRIKLKGDALLSHFDYLNLSFYQALCVIASGEGEVYSEEDQRKIDMYREEFEKQVRELEKSYFGEEAEERTVLKNIYPKEDKEEVEERVGLEEQRISVANTDKSEKLDEYIDSVIAARGMKPNLLIEGLENVPRDLIEKGTLQENEEKEKEQVNVENLKVKRNTRKRRSRNVEKDKISDELEKEAENIGEEE